MGSHANATVGPSFLAAIAAAGFLRCTEQLPFVKAVDVRKYDKADGLESTEGVKRSRSVVSDSAGRIWFSLSSGLSVVNPSQINDNSIPALPHIEAVTADDNPVNLDTSVRIPPSPRRIT